MPKFRFVLHAAVAKWMRELLLPLIKADFTSKEHRAHVQSIFEKW